MYEGSVQVIRDLLGLKKGVRRSYRLDSVESISTKTVYMLTMFCQLTEDDPFRMVGGSGEADCDLECCKL